MPTLRLTEWRESGPVELDAATRVTLESTFKAKISSRPDGLFVVQPGGVIGTVRTPSTTIVVAPRFGIDRVLFMIAYASNPYSWKESTGELGDVDSLIDGMAALFCRAFRRATGQGLLRAYRRIDAESSVVRGRIRLECQLRRPVPVPIAIRYDVHDDDIPENQILRAAVATLRAEATGGRTLLKLNRAWAQVRDLSGLTDPLAALDGLVWDRRNEHYRQLLTMAEIILRGRMADLDAGGVAVDGFTLTMHDVFERFVRVALRDSGGHQTADFPDSWAGRGFSLDASGRYALKPDLGIRRGGAWQFIGDVKYKRDEGDHASDIYQALAYATASGLSDVTLIYAAGSRRHSTVEVAGSGARIHLHRLDLTQPPHDVLAQLRSLALAGRAL